MVTDAEHERDAHAARLRGLLYLACPDASPEGIENTAEAIADSADSLPQTAVPPAAQLYPNTSQQGTLNLSRADLNRADLSGANLSGADLSGADLFGADLHGADLSGAYLRGAYLIGTDLSGANLNGAHLNRAHLNGANLSGANLSGAHLSGANLSDADLHDTDLSDAMIVGTVWSVHTAWPVGVAEEMRERSVPIGGGRWQVQGSGTSGAEMSVPLVPVS
ncbi:pentapeptide repeat-containing protein [Streptomyces sp. NPDC090106]|uniref:pentapeptide repeat-containing protein n=1 Tax=Streptomyces sp. NPDC090106 TaxID=3365946 RepID=UPI003802E94C